MNLKEQRDGVWQECWSCGKVRATWSVVRLDGTRLCHRCLLSSELAEEVFEE